MDGSLRQFPHDHNLLPLCRALLIVLDGVLQMAVPASHYTRKYRGEMFSLFGQKTKMISVRQSIIDTVKLQSFPQARTDVNIDDSDDIIPVSLRVAMHFILDLQRREKLAFADLCCNISALSVNADEHVTEIIREERGGSEERRACLLISEVEVAELFGHAST